MNETLGHNRRIILSEKIASQSDTGWQAPPAPPRLLPFARSMRLNGDWQWRALTCQSLRDDFILLARVNLRMGNYQAWLLKQNSDGLALLARLEDHSSHPGLHAHTHCGDELPLTGTQSIRQRNDGGKLTKRPQKNGRRTVQGQPLSFFWSTARRVFRISDPVGTQGELKI